MAQDKLISRYLRDIYKRLYLFFGPQHWWPADDAFEVVIGAILTQNTSWANVERALLNLKEEKLLNPRRLYSTDIKTIARLIKPCGYYNIKAIRIKNFLKVLFADYHGNLLSMFSLKPALLREKLLKINGIGPETADSIILYAARKPVFVIDAYTRRFLLRHGLIEGNFSYQQLKSLFEQNLGRSLKVFNEFHALIVRLAKEFCRKNPLCHRCPLRMDKRLKREPGNWR